MASTYYNFLLLYLLTAAFSSSAFSLPQACPQAPSSPSFPSPFPLTPLTVHSLENPQTAPHLEEQPEVPPKRNWAPVPGPWEHIDEWSVCLLPWLITTS